MKRIGRRAWFKRPASEYACAGRRNSRSRLFYLLLALNRTWASDYHYLIGSNMHTVHINKGVVGVPRPAGKLVRAGALKNILYAIQNLYVAKIKVRMAPDGTQNRSDSVRAVYVESVIVEPVNDGLDKRT